jgi:hypothetical protein
MRMSKSHTNDELRQALRSGKRLWELDTGSAGEDDILIAEPAENRDDLLSTVLSHFERTELPPRWTLEGLSSQQEEALRAALEG